MSVYSDKATLLDSAGYAYNYMRMMYVNRQAKKAFSIEFLDDHTPSEIEASIREPHNADDWRFYFTEEVSEGALKALKQVLQ